MQKGRIVLGKARWIQPFVPTGGGESLGNDPHVIRSGTDQDGQSAFANRRQTNSCTLTDTGEIGGHAGWMTSTHRAHEERETHFQRLARSGIKPANEWYWDTIGRH